MESGKDVRYIYIDEVEERQLGLEILLFLLSIRTERNKEGKWLADNS